MTRQKQIDELLDAIEVLVNNCLHSSLEAVFHASETIAREGTPQQRKRLLRYVKKWQASCVCNHNVADLKYAQVLQEP